MSLTGKNKRIVEEVPYGTYVWRMNDGTYLVDEEYRHLSVFCVKGNQKAIDALTREARNLGFPDGAPEWKPGHRKVTDEEYEEQEARQASGLVADPYDFGALMDQINASRND